MLLSDFLALPDDEKQFVFDRAMRHADLVQDVLQLKLRVRRLEELEAKRAADRDGGSL